ncbi:hypothetical protein M413DRAFT_439689 [Hebeloma cylindrosporum]|uniref:PXA domain-containing protein n=1 Tax=Hebeloma cylindrosporum TaxID=76867 RepID=A0A0C2YDY8_HEBCY|nr:hypothetical protein M413DRAFT_439689 [Hebeloma cylindrosporum h7]
MPPSLASRLLFQGTVAPTLVSAELSPELYDFIALALRAHVSPWWSKITRYDKDFLPHISTILSTVLRDLHLRAQAADLPALVFHDVPTIITQHYRDYHNAAAKTATAYASGGAAPLSALFAHLQPHMAISPDGSLDREYYRQIVDHILKASLPLEDYDPDAERIIIREIIVKVLLDDIFPKITQPWFIHKAILDLIGSPEQPIFISPPPLPPSSSHSFSFHTIIVIVLSALQSFSGMCLALIHTYKHAITTIKLVQKSPSHSPNPNFAPPPILSQDTLLTKLHAPSITSSPSTSSSVSSNPRPSTFSTPPNFPIPQESYTNHNYTEPPLLLLSEVISAHNRFASTIVITTLSMLSASMTPFLDKLLPHMLQNFLSPAFILNTTRTAKRTLFPNGYPAPQPPDPTLEEQAELRARLVAWRGSGGIALLLPLLLGPDISHTLGTALDPLSDAQCNRRLVVFLLDRILVSFFPELGGSS